ncbi:Alpha-1,3-fucosyltransferase fut-1 [Hondaea fermentalgiana]|uniref:Fucosyltransferase n=1 Tax=Hondaea fermentalgiana TaxID=2315210 RepID=A0A2R5G1J0_9STRA|nr:Alpha-1,3-fucosyltransferase fut-1 [Hondaea fermentalgiana]|eukprot:GBG24169.1 Alpha-1,3-fucosyltransferase fut-1 [Hondaea fermentalgiana]
MVANLEETSTINCDNPQGLLQEAECGHEFRKYYNMTRHDLEGIRVAFYGHIIGSSAFEFQRVSGCPITSKNGAPACLQDPSCSMFKIAKGGDLRGADVVMVDRIDAERLTKTRSWDREIPRMFTRTDQKTGEVLHRRRFRVLYVREASFVSIEAQSEVDFVMGVHYWHGLLNPNFLMRPSTFARRNAKVADAVASKGRPKFAVSVASNCEPTHSRRGVYIDDLAKALGSRGNVDRYGSCHGALAAPPKPLSKMAPIAAEYKFYLAFENTIMDGYVTEKLLQSLTFGPVPVYMGAADIFNITRTPSFINVQDFGSPAELADYLIYLANNQTAYEEYHSWRHVPLAEALSEDYLQRVSRHVPSLAAYAEIRKAYEEAAPQRKVNPLRVANCCTLCFTVVYRSQIAYERYAAAQLAYFNMASKMHDFISFTNAFLLDNDERTLVIRDTLVRWARAYHELALDEFQGTEFIPLDRANLTPEEIELLMRDRKRPIQVSSWMHRLIMENRKCFKAGDAILSRAFQIQTNANMYFNNVRRIAETPFPFPFVQLTSVMIHIWAILTPIVTAAFFPQSYILAGAIAGASTWILFGVNETAAQLELPFEPSANNLPVVYYTVAFDDDMSAVQYMQVPEVFECCRMNDFTTLKAKSALAGDATRTSAPGPDHDAHLPSLHHEPNRAASDVAPDSNSIMSKFRYRNKLDAIMEPEKEDPSSPQLRPRSPNANGSGPLRTESVGSDGINVSRQGSGSKLFDLFSLNRDDILRESGGAKTEENDDPSDSEIESANGAKSSGGSVKDYENRQRALSTNTSPGVKRLNELSKESAGDGDTNTSSDEIRLNISNSKEASKEGTASEDSNDVIQLPRRSSLPNSGLALDDSAIETRIRNRHDEPDNSVAPGERRLIESMDSRAVLYHTVHGAEAKRMAQDLQIEREIQRRAVANRALALQIRVDRQRYDMRHHLRDVPSLNAENYHAGHNHNTANIRPGSPRMVVGSYRERPTDPLDCGVETVVNTARHEPGGEFEGLPFGRCIVARAG